MKFLVFSVLASALMVAPIHMLLDLTTWQAIASYSLSGQGVLGAALIGSIVLKSKG